MNCTLGYRYKNPCMFSIKSHSSGYYFNATPSVIIVFVCGICSIPSTEITLPVLCIMTRGIAGSQVTLCGEWHLLSDLQILSGIISLTTCHIVIIISELYHSLQIHEFFMSLFQLYTPGYYFLCYTQLTNPQIPLSITSGSVQ